MRHLLAATAAIALLATSAAQAAVTYTFSAAPDNGWSAFSFSFTSPSILAAGDPYSISAFTVTHGANSYSISQTASTALATQGHCFLFSTAGLFQPNGANTQCSVGANNPGEVGMWFFTGDTALPSALGTYSNYYVAIFSGDGNFGGQDFAGVVTISDGAAVPEPATWALMISGFGMVGTALRRRRATTVSV